MKDEILYEMEESSYWIKFGSLIQKNSQMSLPISYVRRFYIKLIFLKVKACHLQCMKQSLLSTSKGSGIMLSIPVEKIKVNLLTDSQNGNSSWHLMQSHGAAMAYKTFSSCYSSKVFISRFVLRLWSVSNVIMYKVTIEFSLNVFTEFGD